MTIDSNLFSIASAAPGDIEIGSTPLLDGCKEGILQGGFLAVSPAFMSLLNSARTKGEMTKLLKSLQVKRLPVVGRHSVPRSTRTAA